MKHMAKTILPKPYSKAASVAKLLDIQLCTEGNHPAFQKLENDNFSL